MNVFSFIKAKYRLFFGFCPKCNSSAPEIDTCTVCLGNRDYPISSERKKELWKKFLADCAYNWNHIDTAPENTLLFLYEKHDYGGFMFVGIKNDNVWRNNLDLLEQKPTHWAVLPNAPKT